MKARISNIITESVIKSWKPGDNVLVSAPMGSGKSYFCKNTLYNVAKNNTDKILMLIHRSNCVDQFSYEITESKKDDVITIMTYQSIEYAKLHNTLDKINLSQYRYIVCDEFHYFFNDSSFNNKTSISFELIINNTTATHIFMSATGNNMENYMSKYPCFPITVTRKTYGYLVVNETKYKANEYDLIAIEHASTIIKLEIQREISNDEIERKYRDNLVLDIIYNNINNQDELRERGKLFGWSFEGHVRAMIADVDHFKKNREKNAGSPLWRKCRFRKKRQIVL